MRLSVSYKIGDEIIIISQPLHNRLTYNKVYKIKGFLREYVVVMGNDKKDVTLYRSKFKLYKHVVFEREIREIING